MRKSFSSKVRRLATPLICGAVVLASVGATALAAVGEVSGSLVNNNGTVTLKNTSGSARYCTTYLRRYNEGDDIDKIYEAYKYNSGVISNGNTIASSGIITTDHARGYGSVYAGTASMVPVEYTIWTQVK